MRALSAAARTLLARFVVILRSMEEESGDRKGHSSETPTSNGSSCYRGCYSKKRCCPADRECNEPTRLIFARFHN